MRNFEIVGEAGKNIPRGIKDSYKHIPLEEMYRLRNRITHAYFGKILWDSATHYLPQNHIDILKALEQEHG